MILQNLELRSCFAPALTSLIRIFGRRSGERRWRPLFASSHQPAPARDATPRPIDSRTRSNGDQPYRLLVTSVPRPVAQEALNLLWREFAEPGLVPQRVSLKTHQSSVVIVGSVIGMPLPFLLSRLKLDPATASAPLLTSIADGARVLIYFAIAATVLGLPASD